MREMAIHKSVKIEPFNGPSFYQTASWGDPCSSIIQFNNELGSLYPFSAFIMAKCGQPKFGMDEVHLMSMPCDWEHACFSISLYSALFF